MTAGREILELSAGDYLSSLGNCFIALTTYDGTEIDIVGVGGYPSQEDASVPPAPAAVALSGMSGGLQVEWTGSAAGDLVGYQVYWSVRDFLSPTEVGVNKLTYLISHTSCFLPVANLRVPNHVRITAVDSSGNESTLSPSASAVPLPGTAPHISLVVDELGGMFGFAAKLTASGAHSYDWDLDGDGSWEITGDTTGVQQADTAQAGIVRPRVRGSSGQASNYGAVSLISINNARPVASAYATPAGGRAPLTVNFGSSAVDFDGSITSFLWDIDGDQIWDYATPTEADRNPPPQVFSTPGTYNVKFRVNDDQGAWDVDTVTVQVDANIPPVLTVQVSPQRVMGTSNLSQEVVYDFLGSYDPEGTELTFRIDRFGDGDWTPVPAGEIEFPVLFYDNSGTFYSRIQATDADGGKTYETVMIEVYEFGSVEIPSTSPDYGSATGICNSNGYLSVAFYDANAQNLQFVNSAPLNPGDFTTPFILDSAVGSSTFISMNTNTYDNPALCWYDQASTSLMYRQATNRQGSKWSSPVTVASSGDVGKYCSMDRDLYYQGIAYYDDSGNRIMYLRTESVNGLTWPTPTQVTVASGDYRWISLADIHGNPAIAYYRASTTDIMYVRATNSAGTAWGTPQVIDSNPGDLGKYAQLGLVSGRPAVAYLDSTVGDETIWYLRAEDSTGTTWDSSTRTEIGTVGSTTQDLSMTTVGGYPVVAAFRGDMPYCFVGPKTGVDEFSWVTTPIEQHAGGGFERGRHITVCDWYGMPAAAYYDTENGSLRVARGVIP